MLLAQLSSLEEMMKINIDRDSMLTNITFHHKDYFSLIKIEWMRFYIGIPMKLHRIKKGVFDGPSSSFHAEQSTYTLSPKSVK